MAAEHEDRAPWHHTTHKFDPIGLRGCVLAVWYVYPCDLARLCATRTDSLLRTVARWRVDQPAKFRELCDLFGFTQPLPNPSWVEQAEADRPDPPARDARLRKVG